MKGHFLIIPGPVEDKNLLVKCAAAKENKLKVYNPDHPEEKFIIKAKEVIADLGERPKAGQAYGVKIEPLVRTEEDDFWGEIRSYKFFSDDEYDLFFKGLKDVRKEIKARKLPRPQTDVELRQRKGKVVGMYKFQPKAEKDILMLMACDSDDKVNQYLVAHEYSHGLWYRNMTPKQHMRWIRLYHENISVMNATEKALKQILKDVEAEGSFGPLLTADYEDSATVKSLLKTIHTVHGLNRKHLETALVVGDSLADYWPTSVETSTKEVMVTEYSMKMPEELWAECFAHHFVGTKLPKTHLELLNKTLSNLVK